MPALESWGSGNAYEAYVGRWSRHVAREFLAWLNVSPGGRWLDVGCGTGALSELILESCAPRQVLAIDRSQAYVQHAAEHIDDDRLGLHVADAQALPFASEVMDAAVSALALNFVPKPERAIAEMQRVTRAEGIVAAYVWDYAQGMQFMRYFWDAVIELEPAAAELDEGPRFPICQPGPLQGAFEEAALQQVEVLPIEVPTHFRDYEDFWQPFLGGQGPGPTYVRSLSDASREALRQRLRRTLPFAADGSIPLTARAWAARGRR